MPNLEHIAGEEKIGSIRTLLNHYDEVMLPEVRKLVIDEKTALLINLNFLETEVKSIPSVAEGIKNEVLMMIGAKRSEIQSS